MQIPVEEQNTLNPDNVTLKEEGRCAMKISCGKTGQGAPLSGLSEMPCLGSIT